MKRFVYKTGNGFLFLGTNTSVLKCYMSPYRKHFSAISSTKYSRDEVYSKPIMGVKKQENLYIKKNFFSNQSKELILMDFDVWLKPKIFRSFRALFYVLFVLKKMDNSFSISEFIRSTATALQVVTTLLSQLQFSELEGLLTEDCKEEVERNLKYWTRDEISVLAVKPEKIMNIIAPSDVSVLSDENKIFVEIRVIFYVWLKYSSKFETAFFHSDSLNSQNLNNMDMFGVYNSKFIREFTQGVIDQWRMSAINFKCNTRILMPT